MTRRQLITGVQLPMARSSVALAANQGLLYVFAVVVIAPVAETIVMAAVLELLVRRVPPFPAILLSAAGWASVHSLQAPTWGLVIWWPFLIFSALYVNWRTRDPDWALLIPMAVHALNNLGPTVLLLRSSGALPI